MFGPRSLRDIDRGVKDTCMLGPYEKRFLCGVEGVGAEFEGTEVEVEAVTGGV